MIAVLYVCLFMFGVVVGLLQIWVVCYCLCCVVVVGCDVVLRGVLWVCLCMGGVADWVFTCDLC